MHPLDKFIFCPACGSARFHANSVKSKLCASCGFEYFMNPSSANAAFIINDKRELVVERRRNEPAKGTLDLPGGFSDIGETAEEGVVREVREETGLDINDVKYLFSLPNTYPYSGVDIPTLDIFFLCEVVGKPMLRAMDDAVECFWMPFYAINIDDFGLQSIRDGLREFGAKWQNFYASMCPYPKYLL